MRLPPPVHYYRQDQRYTQVALPTPFRRSCQLAIIQRGHNYQYWSCTCYFLLTFHLRPSRLTARCAQMDSAGAAGRLPISSPT